MSIFSDTNIVIITDHFSVIVRGIENKLKEIGYKVSTIEDKYDKILDCLDFANLFIFNLPVDINEDTKEYKDLISSMNVICNSNIETIFIGEKRNHETYIMSIPSLANKPWINRPVDIESLSGVINNYILDEKKKQEQKSILIVDDDPAYAKMVREWIKDTYKISIVTAGMQAIKFLVKNKVDLILLDYEMPVVDGPQILEMLKSEPDTADIPVVFLTGIGTRESIERVKALKPSGYILKTTTRDELLEYINDLFTQINED